MNEIDPTEADTNPHGSRGLARPAPNTFGADVSVGSNASGLSLQTWTWPTEQLSDDAVRIVLQIIEGLGSSRPSRSRVAQGSVTADFVSLSYVEATSPILADWIESESISPRAALGASEGLVAGLIECEERNVAIGRWDPAFINELENGGWSLPTPGLHGLPMGSRPLIVSLTEAAACAPEAATGAMELSSCTPVQRARAEAYALGATLYWALSGQLPLQADTPEQYCRAQLESTPKPLLEVAPHLERYATLILLVDRCLARSPEERPQSHEELTHELSIAAREADRLENSVSFFPLRVSDSEGMDLPSRKHGETDLRQLALKHNQRQLWVLITLIGLLLFLGYYQAHSPEMASPKDGPALVPEEP
jgi:serine/threonine protein kinase